MRPDFSGIDYRPISRGERRGLAANAGPAWPTPELIGVKPHYTASDLAACNGYANGVEAAKRVSCPALVILGARDVMAPTRNAKALIEALADVRTVTLPDTGHSMMTERPDDVLDALRNFLGVSRAT